MTDLSTPAGVIAWARSLKDANGFVCDTPEDGAVAARIAKALRLLAVVEDEARDGFKVLETDKYCDELLRRATLEEGEGR